MSASRVDFLGLRKLANHPISYTGEDCPYEQGGIFHKDLENERKEKKS